MLRIILLVIGILIILGIAFDGWRRKQRRLQQSRDLLNSVTQTIVNEIPANHEALLTEKKVTVDEGISAEPDLPQINPKHPDDNVVHLEKSFAESKSSGSYPIAIDDVEINETSANQKLATPESVSPQSIQSANEALPKSGVVPEVAPVRKPAEVITLTIMSINSRPFAGYDIINALKDNHLHHGEFDIYHRYKYRNGKGPLYFSAASVVKPGTINPRKIGELSTPGLALFMKLDNPKHDRTVFKQILATAHQLAKKLGGVVCDDKRIPLRESSLDAYADKINL